MKYTLSLLFDYKLENVILMEKDRGLYKGKLNGIGGQVEDTDNTEAEAALREVFEETDIQSDQLMSYMKLLSVTYANDAEVAVYCGIIKEGCDFRQKESEKLMWMPIKETRDVSDDRFAGDGDLSSYIHASLLLLSGKSKRVK